MKFVEMSLDELGFVGRGKSRHRPRNAKHLYGGRYPFIQTAEVKHSELYITSYEQTYSDAGLDQSKLWPIETLCITIAANIAETAILGIESCFPDSVIGFIADKKKSDPRFIKYTFDTLKRSYQQVSQGAAQDNLSLEKLLSIKLRVPKNVEDQSRIADILSTYDDLIENNRRRMGLLEKMARLLYEEWFVRLRFPGHEHAAIVDGLPQGWERAPFEDALVLQRGFDLPKNYWKEGNFPICGSTGIIGHHVEARVKSPGVYTGRSGSLGVVNYIDEDFWPHNTTLWVKEFKRVSPLFALFLLRSMNLKQYNGGASVPTLDRKAVHRVEIQIPPRPLIALFDEQVSPIFLQLRLLHLQNQKLRIARDLLLPRLISGEIEV